MALEYVELQSSGFKPTSSYVFLEQKK